MAKVVEHETMAEVGEQDRFDQRQVVFNRARLGELGERIRERLAAKPTDPFRRIFHSATSNNYLWLSINTPDGPVNPERIEVSDPILMARHVKEVAKFLGADLVGISEMERAYVYSHRGRGYDIGTPSFGERIELHHRYAISIGVEMNYDKIKAAPSFITDAENGARYSDVAKTVFQLAAYIRELGYPARAHHLNREEVLHVPLAIKAGLGELGRNGFLITREFGPRLRLGTVTTDLPLAPDRSVNLGVQEFCEQCKKCAVNCPPKAIPMGEKVEVRGIRKWKINPDPCLKFWLSNPSQWSSCANCIKTCPWNKPNRWYHHLATWGAARSSLTRTLLLWLDDLINGKKPNYRVRWLDYGEDNSRGPNFLRPKP